MIFFATSMVTLWFMAVLQFALPERVPIGGFAPDFILIGISTLALLLPRGGAAASGFLGGLLQGAIVGANLTHYAISRTVTGFVVAWSRETRIELTLVTAAIAAFLATLLAGVIFMFGAAPRNLGSFLLDTIGSAVYNGVLAIPVYALLRRILGEPSKRRG